jgi:RNA polymerase sigma-70 factor (ECF subfamily)
MSVGSTGDIGRQIVALLPRLRVYARALTRSSEAADDLVQATCERALRGIAGWTPGTRLDGWMFRIMRNHWIDEQRRPRLLVSDSETAIATAGGVDGRRVTEVRLTLDAVRAAIEALPEEQRSVLVLTCVQELSYRETAEILDVPVGTVKSRLARARRVVAAAIGEGSEAGSELPGGSTLEART